MTILVGLGNPGRKYSDTKHNFGFWIINHFVEKKSLVFQSGKGDYLLAKQERLVCIKPTTFMNNRGEWDCAYRCDRLEPIKNMNRYNFIYNILTTNGRINIGDNEFTDYNELAAEYETKDIDDIYIDYMNNNNPHFFFVHDS